jgi:hypothetical protein
MRRLLPSLAAVALAVLAPATASGAAWRPPRTVASSGDSSSPSVALDDRGHAAVAYVRSLGGTRRAEVRRGAVVGTSAGEVLLAYVSRARPAVYDGAVRLARFDDALRPSGTPRTLSPRGATAQRVTIAAGSSAAFAAWATVGPGPDAIQAIRVAPGGILSHVSTIDRGNQRRPPVLAVNASTQALLAWMRPGGDIRAAIRR